MTVKTGSVPTIAAGTTTTLSTSLATYRDFLKAASEAWTAYVPTWTATANPVLGNGSFNGSAYARLDKLVIFRIVLTMGTTTTYGTGGWVLTLPVAPINAGRMTFLADIVDTGTANYSGRLVVSGGSASGQLLCPGTSAGGSERAVAAAVPFSWGSTDQLTINGVYEAA